jgi:hypothetical protein
MAVGIVRLAVQRTLRPEDRCVTGGFSGVVRVIVHTNRAVG